MIRPITAQQTYSLRHQVLWPDHPLEFVKVPDDASGFHFGYFADEELVGIISLFVNEQHRSANATARFRKFAIRPDFQRRGIGSLLLRHVFDYARGLGAVSIGCDARLDARPFYARLGMQQSGDGFYKGEIPYVTMSTGLQ